MTKLSDVKRIGPPLPRMTVPCPSCAGAGYIESGFMIGSNVGRCHTCAQCRGTGLVWADAPIPIGEAIR